MVLVRKKSSKLEAFDEGKLMKSLLRANASKRVAKLVVEKVKEKLYDGISTEEIYKEAFRILREEEKHAAIKYDLKRALFRLGPTGFYFENYISELFREVYNYETKVRRLIRGKCVEHEVDVICKLDGDEYMLVECKYHNSQGIYTGLKTVMYTFARFLDLMEGHKLKFCENFTEVCLATNTKFSDKAKAYASCRGIKLIGWKYPKGESLNNLIDKKCLYPVTILRNVDSFSLERLANANLLLVKDLIELSAKEIRSRTGLREKDILAIVEEAEMLLN